MNDYLKGTIDTCQILATTKDEFKSSVKTVTGMTDKGIAGHKYIQGIISTWEI